MTLHMFTILCNEHCLMPQEVIFDLPDVNWKELTYDEANEVLSESY